MQGGEHAGCGFGKDDVAPARAVSEGARLPCRGRRLPKPLGGGARRDSRFRVRPRGVGHGQTQENEGRRTHPRRGGGVQAGIHEPVRWDGVSPKRCGGTPIVTITSPPTGWPQSHPLYFRNEPYRSIPFLSSESRTILVSSRVDRP